MSFSCWLLQVSGFRLELTALPEIWVLKKALVNKKIKKKKTASQ